MLSGQMLVHWLRSKQTIYSVNEVVSRKKDIWKTQYIRTMATMFLGLRNVVCYLCEVYKAGSKMTPHTHVEVDDLGSWVAAFDPVFLIMIVLHVPFILNDLVHWLLVNEMPCASCTNKGVYQV